MPCSSAAKQATSRQVWHWAKLHTAQLAAAAVCLASQLSTAGRALTLTLAPSIQSVFTSAHTLIAPRGCSFISLIIHGCPALCFNP